MESPCKKLFAASKSKLRGGVAGGATTRNAKEMRARRVLTLFSSPTCSLCVPVKEMLAEAVAASGGALELRMVDISARHNVAVFRLYKHDIPVVLLDGVEVARHRLTRDELASCLERRA